VLFNGEEEVGLGLWANDYPQCWKYRYELCFDSCRYRKYPLNIVQLRNFCTDVCQGANRLSVIFEGEFNLPARPGGHNATIGTNGIIMINADSLTISSLKT
jgi:hypothetical protein